MSCLCGYAELPAVMGARMTVRWHDCPEPRRPLRVHAWKLGQPFPWTAGTWPLEVDLYGG